MHTVSDPAVGARLDSPVLALKLRGRARAWTALPEVRAAFVATLALRLATSGFAMLVVATLNAAYVHAVSTLNATGGQLGIFIVPASLSGPSEYLTGPWLRWDANIYYAIAQRGYTFVGISPFLPLYPALVRLATLVTFGHTAVAALLVSTLATFAAFISLYRLVVRLTDSVAAARYSLVAACLLPVAFFLMAPYTEAVFLAFSLAAILSALDRSWGRATIFAVLASLTRQQGVLLAALAIPELWASLRPAWGQRIGLAERAQALWQRAWRPGLFAVAPALAYGAWMLVLVFGLHFPSPAESLTSTSHGWGQHFTVPGLGVLVDLIILFMRPGDVIFHHIDIELDALAAISAAWGLVVARKWLPAGLFVYLLLCWCVALTKVSPLWTTNSASRYLLAMLPLCLVPGIWLAQTKPPLRLAWLTMCALLAAWVFLNWMLWVWVA